MTRSKKKRKNKKTNRKARTRNGVHRHNLGVEHMEERVLLDGGGLVNITSPAVVDVAENETAVITVDTDAPELDPTFNIVAGDDASKFNITSDTGELTFVDAPDFETPKDTGEDNVYEVEVEVEAPSAQVIADENFEGGGTGWFNEHTSSDPTYESSGGFSQYLGRHASNDLVAKTFTLANSTGDVTVAFDFYEIDTWDTEEFHIHVNGTQVLVPAALFSHNIGEADVTGANGDVSYNITATTAPANIAYLSHNDQIHHVTLTVSNPGETLELKFGSNLDSGEDDEAWGVDNLVITQEATVSDTQLISVSVTDIDEPPVFSSPTIFTAVENQAAVGTVAAPDPEGSGVTYSLGVAGQSGLFTIDETSGVIEFNEAPNFESPLGAAGSNGYEVEVLASDGSISNTQMVTVNVADANESPVLTNDGAQTVDGNSTATNTGTWSDVV